METMDLVRNLERLKRPPGGPTSTGQEQEPSTDLRHFDVRAVDILMDRAYWQGAERGLRNARDEYGMQLEQMQLATVQDAMTQFLTWLIPLYEELEGALVAPVVTPEEDEERPADEWADDRADRLQRVLDAFRDALPPLARVAGQDGLLPPLDFFGQVSLWREVHPVEQVTDIEAVPAEALTNKQLAAVLDGNTDAFEHAGKVIVPKAIAVLRQRASVEHADYAGVKASAVLAERDIALDKAPDEAPVPRRDR